MGGPPMKRPRLEAPATNGYHHIPAAEAYPAYEHEADYSYDPYAEQPAAGAEYDYSDSYAAEESPYSSYPAAGAGDGYDYTEAVDYSSDYTAIATDDYSYDYSAAEYGSSPW